MVNLTTPCHANTEPSPSITFARNRAISTAKPFSNFCNALLNMARVCVSASHTRLRWTGQPDGWKIISRWRGYYINNDVDSHCFRRNVFFFFFFQLNESFNNVVYTRSRLEVVNWSRYRDVLFTIKLLTRKRQAINLLSTEARPPMLFRR